MVHAEKIVTAVDRGPTNTRWRDFADVYSLSGRHTVAADELRGAITRVAEYRLITLAPIAASLPGWSAVAQPRWSVWRRKQQLADGLPAEFGEVLQAVASFADPVLVDAVGAGVHWNPAERAWHRQTVRTARDE
jgi:hypothetical protein